MEKRGLMRSFVTVLIVLFCLVSWSEKLSLPGYYKPKELKLTPIQKSTEAYLNINLILPKGQKLNKKARSEVSIFEKWNGQWQKTGRVNLNNTFSFGQEIHLKQKVSFQSTSGPTAVGATIYHCAKDGRFCVIDYYQGLLERSDNEASKVANVKIKATPPSF